MCCTQHLDEAFPSPVVDLTARRHEPLGQQVQDYLDERLGSGGSSEQRQQYIRARLGPLWLRGHR
jgi:hypothetical protein